MMVTLNLRLLLDFSLLVAEKRRRKRKRKREPQHQNQKKLMLMMVERKRRRRRRPSKFLIFHLADHYHHHQLLHDYTQLNIVYVFTILYKMFLCYVEEHNCIPTIIDHTARKNLSICDDLHLMSQVLLRMMS